MSKLDEIKKALQAATPGPWMLVMDSYDDEKDTHFPWMIINADGEEICDFSGGGDVKLENAHIMTNAPKWLRFLLDELERERAAHNAHVTELCQLEEETRKLLEERDEARSKAEEAWKEIDSLEEQLLSSQQDIERLRQLYERERETADQALEQVKNLREERNQDRQWIEKASENVTQLQQERDMLIEVLRFYADEETYEGDVEWDDAGNIIHAKWPPINVDNGQRARDILREIGVTDV